MDENRKKADWPIIAGIVAPVLLLVAYTGGYFLLSEVVVSAPGRSIRVFQSEWMARLYQPAAKIESLASGRKVLLGHHP